MNSILSVLSHTEVNMASYEVMLQLVILTGCLLFRASRLGLIAAYIFAYRWGWLVFERSFGTEQPAFIYGYMVFGFLTLILAVLSMWRAYGTD